MLRLVSLVRADLVLLDTIQTQRQLAAIFQEVNAFFWLRCDCGHDVFLPTAPPPIKARSHMSVIDAPRPRNVLCPDCYRVHFFQFDKIHPPPVDEAIQPDIEGKLYLYNLSM
jgi:hypothetical protein